MFKAIVAFAFVAIALAKNEVEGPLDNYKLWCQGNCDKDAVVAGTKSGVVLMGGGTDTDEAFLWQIQNANKGDFVVLRTSGDDAYNPYIYELSIAAGAKVNSVTSILMKNRKASAEKEVLTALRNAEAIFLAGGDCQSEYIDFWKDTEVQSIIQSKLSSNVTIGGTSAGCMVLGKVIGCTRASQGSAVSDESLADPYNKYIDVLPSPSFLTIPYLDSIITDTHFVTRNRMGRLLTFTARIMKDVDMKPPTLVRGVGIDEHSALLLDTSTGDVQAVGVGTAYVCLATAPAAICVDGQPLTEQALSCQRLSGKNKDSYSFKSFQGGPGVVSYESNIVAGHFTNEPYGPV